MSEFKSSLNGVPFLVYQLKSLGRRVEGPISSQAVRAALKVSYEAIKPRVGKAGQTLGYRLAARKRTNLIEGIVGIGVGYHATRFTRYLPTLVTGTESRFRKTKSGKTASTGRIVGNNGVAIGMAASAADAAAAMEASIKKSLSKLTK